MSQRAMSLEATCRVYRHAVCYSCGIVYRFRVGQRDVFPDHHECGDRLYYPKNPMKVNNALLRFGEKALVFGKPTQGSPRECARLQNATGATRLRPRPDRVVRTRVTR